MNSFSTGGGPLPTFGKNWGWFLLWGIALVVLGVAALYYATLTTMLTILILGFIIFTGGIVVLIDTFTFWWRKWKGFFIHLVMALLYVFVGWMLLSGPVWGSLSITLLLGLLYIFLGIMRLYYSISMRAPLWGWTFFNGLIALLLGVLIIQQWPTSGLFIIGIFVGIDLIFTGWTYIIASLAARNMISKSES